MFLSRFNAFENTMLLTQSCAAVPACRPSSAISVSPWYWPNVMSDSVFNVLYIVDLHQTNGLLCLHRLFQPWASLAGSECAFSVSVDIAIGRPIQLQWPCIWLIRERCTWLVNVQLISSYARRCQSGHWSATPPATGDIWWLSHIKAMREVVCGDVVSWRKRAI